MSEKATFKFGENQTVDKQQNSQGITTEVKNIKSVEEDEVELNRPYVDKRSVTISLTKNYSLYRKVNDKVMSKRTDVLGSSVKSSRSLSANVKELSKYYPSIIGLSYADPKFIERVKQYLNNFHLVIDELGKTLDTTFNYDKKSFFLAVSKREKEIDNEFKNTNKSNINNLKRALAKKIYDTDLLEQSKVDFGMPNNIEDYIIYRHCLLHSQVAKDSGIINSEPSIRFYFKDDVKEERQKKELQDAINRSRSNYVSILSDDKLFDAVYIQYCINTGKHVSSSMFEERYIKEQNIDKFANTNPVKFNEICQDRDIKTKSMIEHFISKGIIIRLPNNQNITTTTGELIAANMKEAIVYFNNPENSSILESMKSQLNY